MPRSTKSLSVTRQYNRRFLQMCSHHLIEPVACTPAAGWEKGQVENQVGNLRDQMFRPKPRVKSLVELNVGWKISASPTHSAPSIRSSRTGPVVAPVELVGFPRRKAHRHIGMHRNPDALIAP